MKKSLLLVIFPILFQSCNNDDGATVAPPTANFSTSERMIDVGTKVSFTNGSENADNYNWTFSGGDPTTSTLENPMVTYSIPGTYDVGLKVTNVGGEDTETKTEYITVIDPTVTPMADFTVASTNTTTGQGITFTDTSTNGPTAWEWSFEGGSPATSTDKDPTITYNTAGTYSVTLIATNSAGSDTETRTDYISVTDPVLAPVATFNASSTAVTTGQNVTFTDTSTNGPTAWEWSFEGGSPATSTAQDPTIAYNTAGTYAVTLIATNSAGSDTETRTGYISVTDPVLAPVATFDASSTAVTTGQNVTFTDTSTNGPTAWEWSFEGGSPATSTAQDPTIAYNTAGTYAVTLIATNSAGSDTETRTGYISVTDPVLAPVATFNASSTAVTTGQNVTFTDTSTNGPTAWEWSFEGGSPATSTAQDPTITYNTAGTYTVTLIATNSAGSDTETRTGYISVTDPVLAPVATFNASSTAVTTGQNVTFTDTSTNGPTAWEWSFEGGSPATSTDKDPAITYNTAGTYSVTLIATNSAGSDTETRTGYISVTNPASVPDAEFTASSNTITSGQDILFTDQSTNGPTSWSWSFPGGNPSTSTDQNPTITYNNYGTYEVSLTATNSAGSTTNTKNGYITVNQQMASYTVTFSGNWSATNHPVDFPGGDHFSAAVGMVHKPGVKLFEEGQLASTGIEDMAELGNNGALSQEVHAFIAQGEASSYINGANLGGGTMQTTFTISVNEEYPMATIVSMIAPSPDWFVAAKEVNLFDNGAFVNSLIINGVSYDSGTDSGLSFRSDNEDTNPAENISKITTAPLGNGTTVDPPVAFFIFEKN